MLEQGRPMGQELVQAPIQVVLLRQPEILLQQIGHRAAPIPVPVQSPLAARFDQPIRHQRLQHVPPVGPFPRHRQALPRKPLQLQLPPQPIRHPARTPLPRPPQRKLLQPHLRPAGTRVLRDGARGRIQRQLLRPLRHRIKDFDRLGPRRPLAVVDLPQIQQRSLDPRAPRRAHLLRDAPVTMILAVLEPVMALEKRMTHRNARHPTTSLEACGRG